MDDASIFVLAGGRSSRMGSDKALLPCGSADLLQLTLDKAKGIIPCPVIVGSRERYAQYGAVIEDMIPGCGPLSGIHAALSTTQSDLNLILSVDMPLMSADFLGWLLQTAAESEETVVVPEADGRTQPLCAVYRRAALEAVEKALRASEYKVDRLFRVLPTRVISRNEWLAAGFAPDIFCNINTPEEYEAVVSKAEGLSPAWSAGLKS